jgi:NAD(P)H-dependent flavin oxidoreductase YrpB (nitropropane dioxygenase family)
MLYTRLCDLLGIEFPILCASMGPGGSGPELVAAISNGGGLGIMPRPYARRSLGMAGRMRRTGPCGHHL